MSHKRAEDVKQGARAAEDTGDNGGEAQRMLYDIVIHFSLALQRPKLEHRREGVGAPERTSGGGEA